MIAILWRYRVKPAHRAEFEATYGPDGDWARLFRRHAHYLGTELLRGDQKDYLTIDRWRREADFDEFMADHHADYKALDAATESWTEEEVKLGVWEAPLAH
jgi:heme-degrading monooxygenase HmoA